MLVTARGLVEHPLLYSSAITIAIIVGSLGRLGQRHECLCHQHISAIIPAALLITVSTCTLVQELFSFELIWFLIYSPTSTLTLSYIEDER